MSSGEPEAGDSAALIEPLYTAAEMTVAEERYPGYPDSMNELMERAGRAVADAVLDGFPDARTITVVCGSGSNGGDGRIAARLLAAEGRDVRIVDLKPEDEPRELGRPDVFVDAIFGTGFTGEPRAEAARLIEEVNALDVAVVSVDIASGVDASTSKVSGPAIEAAMTVALHGAKVGNVVAPGRFHAGKLVVADIGLEPISTEHGRATPRILSTVPRRTASDNKHSAGSVLLVGGSRGLTGAACLAARAALRADAGYVAVAAPASAVPALETHVVEAVKRSCAEDEEGRLTSQAFAEIVEQAARAKSVAIGPGLGRSAETRRLVKQLLAELDLPIVLDADGLWELEPVPRHGPLVLTPHAGELGGLLGAESAWVEAHRLEAAFEAARRFGAVVVLKGADTIVTTPEQGALVCDAGTPALATAGTGDVLTGVIAAFLAKGMEAGLAAAAGAVAQQQASTLLDHQTGAIASDVIAALPAALARPRAPAE